MFKRRKPDEAAEKADTSTGPHPPPAGVTNSLFGPDPTKEPAAEADTGLGVPSYQAALQTSSSSSGSSQQELSMARSPFAPQSPVPPAPVPGTPPAAPARPATSGFGAPAAAPERRTLVVGRGISVQGSVQDAERLVVEGTVEATTISASELSISLGGVFKGEAEVEDAEVAGTIDGTLTARQTLIVRSTGRVLGTARCHRLQVEDGGQITGRIEMISTPSPDSVSRPVQSTPFQPPVLQPMTPPSPPSFSTALD